MKYTSFIGNTYQLHVYDMRHIIKATLYMCNLCTSKINNVHAGLVKTVISVSLILFKSMKIQPLVEYGILYLQLIRIIHNFGTYIYILSLYYFA